MSSVAAYMHNWFRMVIKENNWETTTFQQKNDFGRGDLLIILFINHGEPPVFKLPFFASRGFLSRGGIDNGRLTLIEYDRHHWNWIQFIRGPGWDS